MLRVHRVATNGLIGKASQNRVGKIMNDKMLTMEPSPKTKEL